jgi:hypothetical protein
MKSDHVRHWPPTPWASGGVPAMTEDADVVSSSHGDRARDWERVEQLLRRCPLERRGLVQAGEAFSAICAGPLGRARGVLGAA